MDRYPRIFRFIQAQLGADTAIRILSFGCSTGEEVISLRRHFPHAVIKGIDVNPANIARCLERLKQTADPLMAFAAADSTSNEPDGAYDVIFCMALFRHGDLSGPGVTCCDHRIEFAAFARAIADLSRCLKPRGLLVIRNSNFRLCDTPAGAEFETILSLPVAEDDTLRVFGPDNRLLAGVRYPDTVFRRIQ